MIAIVDRTGVECGFEQMHTPQIFARFPEPSDLASASFEEVYDLYAVRIIFDCDDHTKENGICNVKCKINDLPLYFVFDTGASTVSLSMVEATFMMKNGYLDKKDVVGSQYFLDANGNVSEGTLINIRKVDFGGLKLENVHASVVRNQKAPLLLGQSILSRLGRIEIDNSNHILKITQTVK